MIDNSLPQTQASYGQSVSRPVARKSHDLAAAAAESPTVAQTVPTPLAPTNDRVHLSTDSRMRAHVHGLVQQTPAARLDLVATLRAQIASGSYTVDDRALAQQIIAQHGLRSE